MVAIASFSALLALPVYAQSQKTVNGLVVNIGIVNAIDAEHSDAQHGAHKGSHGPGSQHVLVSIAEEKSGARVGDAQVSIELKNPKGVVQKKALMPMVTSGYPDYSEVFDFAWSGKYQLRVMIQRKGAKPIETTFTVNHVI
jgi:uncharacterized protein involved in high-affinity Fe2+ transport